MYIKTSLLAGLAAGLATRQTTSPAPVSQTTCNGKTYTYNQLAGFGQIPDDARDKFGDTIGGIGSGIAIPRASWQKHPEGYYTGLLWTTPDRGWNTEGTINYESRIEQYQIVSVQFLGRVALVLLRHLCSPSQDSPSTCL